jgi:hypothetical protein
LKIFKNPKVQGALVHMVLSGKSPALATTAFTAYRGNEPGGGAELRVVTTHLPDIETDYEPFELES